MFGWNRIQKWIGNTVTDRIVSAVQPHVQGKVLDVGCWNGTVSSRLRNVDSTGIDVVDPPAPVIPVQRFDGVHIPFPDKSFDTVLCSFVLHHADRPDELFREMIRVGKKLVIVEDSIETTFNRLSVIWLHDIMVKTDNMPYHKHGFRKIATWRSFFESEGMAVRTFEPMGSVHPCWLFLRHFVFVLEPKGGSA